MWTDPIIEEIHQIRTEHAAQFNYDLAAIVKDLRAQEQQSGKKLVARPPRLFVVDKTKNGRAKRSNHKALKQRTAVSQMV